MGDHLVLGVKREGPPDSEDGGDVNSISSGLGREPSGKRLQSTNLSSVGGKGGRGGGSDSVGGRGRGGGGGGGSDSGGRRGGRGGMEGDLEAGPGDGLGLGSVGVRMGLSLGDGPIPRSTWNPALAMGVSIEEESFVGRKILSPWF